MYDSDVMSKVRVGEVHNSTIHNCYVECNGGYVK